MNNTQTGQPTQAPLADHSHYAPIPTGTHAQDGLRPGYPQPQTAPKALDPSDPGRTLGVVGLVLSVFANVIGLVVSTLAYRKSKRAGFRNGAALAGIVVGALTTLGLLTAGIIGGFAAKNLIDTCQDLGPGEHVVNGVTYTCG